MKKILILNDYSVPKMKETIKILKENLDLNKFSIMSSIMFAGGEKSVTIEMFVASQQDEIIAEPNKTQVVVGFANKKIRFNKIISFNKEVVQMQELFLETMIPDFNNKVHTTRDSNINVSDMLDLLEEINKED